MSFKTLLQYSVLYMFDNKTKYTHKEMALSRKLHQSFCHITSITIKRFGGLNTHKANVRPNQLLGETNSVILYDMLMFFIWNGTCNTCSKIPAVTGAVTIRMNSQALKLQRSWQLKLKPFQNFTWVKRERKKRQL